VNKLSETHIPVLCHMSFRRVRMPDTVPLVKLFGHESRRFPVANVIEPTGQDARNVVPVEESYNIQSIGSYNRGMIDKQVS